MMKKNKRGITLYITINVTFEVKHYSHDKRKFNAEFRTCN